MVRSVGTAQNPVVVGTDGTMPSRETLCGERVAFTGRLASMTRREAQERVRRAGGTPTTTISGRTTMLVVGAHGWPLVRDGGVSRVLTDAEDLQAAGHTIRIVPETAFVDLLREGGAPPADAEALAKSFPLERVAQLVGVTPSTVSRWEHLGLVRSNDGLYDFQDIVSLQLLASLMQRGVSASRIQASLTGLSGVLPGTERPLAQLKIVVADSGELLAQIGDSLIAPDGQHYLSFDPSQDAPGDAAIAGECEPRRMEDPSAEAFFERALRLEEEEAYDEAADAYRRAIALCPDFSEAYFNLGNVVRLLGRLDGAAELYKLAATFDPNNELVWYNLADVQEETDQIDDAVRSLRAALDVSPDFPDAHFNLASCLELSGRKLDARTHWRRYLAFDPTSEWAEIARARLRA